MQRRGIMQRQGMVRGAWPATAVALVAGLCIFVTVWNADAGDESGNRPGAHRRASASPSSSAHEPGARKPAGRNAVPGASTSTPSTSAPSTSSGTSTPTVSREIAHASDKGAHAVNITIDDGPDPVWTPRVLKVLRKNKVKAVFCMIGANAAAHPAVVRQIVAEGHRLCDHSVHHDITMDHKSHSYQHDEIVDAEHMIEHASGGVKSQYYRAPGGAFTPYSRKLAASMGMRPLGWNVDTEDYRRPGTQAILHTVKRELRNGPTILFHDGGGDRSQTVAALADLLPHLRHEGYAFGFPVR